MTGKRVCKYYKACGEAASHDFVIQLSLIFTALIFILKSK